MEPVVIVGAGPVGLTTALLLARHRVPSVMLEAAARRSPAGSRAICFQRDVLDVLDRVGCAEPLLAEGVTWTVGRTFYREHEVHTVTFPGQGTSTLPPWINISQAAVESHLRDAAYAEPLIDLRWGHQVTGLRRHAAGVEVDATTSGARVIVRGSHLVGADGSKSAVRQLLGIAFPGQSFDDRFLICDIRADLPFPNERRFFFDPSWNPGRQVLVHQCPHSTWRIDWQVPADFDLAAERADGRLHARIRMITGNLPYEIEWATAYRFHERVAATLRAGNAFLAGDAAHLYAPFGARGLNSGIQDAENLAWKLALVWHGQAPEGLLDSYHAERRAAAAENLRVTSATVEFLVPQTSEQRASRTAVLERAVRDARARSLIDSGRLAEPFWYLDSPLTTPSGGETGFPTGPGQVRPPVPGVLCPDGPVRAGDRVTRLRRLFGDGFVVLVAAARRATAALEVARAAVPVSVAVHALGDLDGTAALGAAMDTSADSVHLVRPDGHLAAVMPVFDRAGLAAALRRAIGLPSRPVPYAGAHPADDLQKNPDEP